MKTDAPILDDRKSIDIYKQSLALARYYCPEWAEKWQADFDPNDPGMVILKLFSKITEHIINQLNRVPEKHRIAFLDFMGIDLLPAQAAKVPLTFYLAEGASRAYIPEGSSVASKEPEVVFETTKGLSVSPAKLKAVFVLDPLNDNFTEYSRDIKEKEDEFSVFGDKKVQNLEHVLYIGDDLALDIRTLPKHLAITFTGKILSKIYFSKFHYGYELLKSSIEKSDSNNVIVNLSNLKLPIDKDKNFCLQVEPDGNMKSLLPFYWDEIVEIDEKRFEKFIQNTFYPDLEINSVFERIGDNKIIIKSLDGSIITLNKEVLGPKELINVYLNEEWISSLPYEKENNRIKFSPLPQINKITVDIAVANILPEMAFFNNTPVDIKKGFYPFGESPKVGNALYIGSDEVFSKEGAIIKLTLSFNLKNPKDTNMINAVLKWEYWHGTERSWQEILGISDTTKAFTVPGSENTISFKCPPQIGKTEINGLSNKWIRVRIDNGGYGEEGKYEPVPEEVDSIIEGIKAEEKAEDYDLAELKKTVATKFKFSEASIDKTFAYLDLEEIAKPAELMDKLDKSLYQMKKVGDVISLPESRISFEDKLKEDSMFDAKTITKILVYTDFNSNDDNALVIKKLEESKHRIEAIKSVVDFQKSEKFEVLNKVGQKLKEKYAFGFRYVPPTINTPYIKSLNLEYEYFKKEISKIEIYNNFKLNSITKSDDPNFTFEPYILLPEKTPSMYLGFENEKMAGAPLALYFAIKESQFGQEKQEASASVGLTDSGTGFKWEYYDGKSTKRLIVDDETESFTVGGIVSFQVPSNIKTSSEFNQDMFWIKITPEGEKQAEFPELKGISLNTIWAVNITTTKDEILGSGNGIPNLSLSFSKKPILEGQLIEINEAGILSEDEKKVIVAEEGEDAVREVKDEKTGDVKGVWVRWHEVKNFSFSGRFSRHYILDRLNGKIYFGDGVRGIVPSKGKNNIVAKEYKSGGGKAGNLDPGKITVLKRKLPNIESVTNHVSSSGGRDQENLPAAVTRGPHSLKNRNKAVTKEDYEWLAYEASQNVAKTECILQPSRINIIIVPDSNEAAPLPDAGLIDSVERYLKERALFIIRDDKIEVVGPEYETIDIDLEAEIVRDFASETNIVKEKIEDRLRKFLHPLKGGQNGEGWNFGQGIFISEVATVVKAIDSVDLINNITLKKEERNRSYFFEPANMEKDKQEIGEFLQEFLDVNWVKDADITISEKGNIKVTMGEKWIGVKRTGDQEETGGLSRVDDIDFNVTISDGREYKLLFSKDNASIKISVTGVGYLPIKKTSLPKAGSINIDLR